MVKTIIKDDNDLFTTKVVNVWANKQGLRSYRPQEVRYAKLGNSLTWCYSLDENNKASFYRVDRNGDFHDETEVVPGCGGNDDIYVGDYVWFKSEGKFSTWGKMVPPKNPARRALWEHFYFIPKQACRFELTDEQFSTVMERWDLSCVESSKKYENFDVMRIRTVYDIDNNPILSVLVRRTWSNQNWRVVELAARENLNGDRLYNNTIKICKMVDAMNFNVKRETVDADDSTNTAVG